MASDVIAHMVADTPLLLWACQEVSGHLQDSSGNGRHSTTTTAVAYGAADADTIDGPTGADKCIWLANSTVVSRSVVSMNADNISIEFVTAKFGVLTIRNGTVADGWVIHNGPSVVNLTLPNSIAFGNTIPITPARWHHIVIRRSGGTWTGWKDGVLTTTFGTNGRGAETSTFALENGSSAGLAYLALYNSALSDARILERAQLLGLA